jgi:DNA polymerase III subunit delta
MILFLYGKDTFRSRAQLKKMITKFKEDRDPQGYNTVTVDCVTETPAKVQEQMLAIPFLAEKRMVVIENLLISKQKELAQTILDRIEAQSFPDDTILVFWEGNDKFRTKVAKELFARLGKEKFAQGFEELSGTKLDAWIIDTVKRRGGQIARSAAQDLSRHLGSDTWRLNTLIDQLIAFKNNEEITPSDVLLFVDEKADDNIFNLVDAIVQKKPKKVFHMIEEQYTQGKDAHYVFAMVARQFKILLELKDASISESFQTGGTLAKAMGLHPFVVKKTMPMVKQYKLEELEKVHSDLLLLDKKTKIGQGDLRTLLDLFIGKLAKQTS